MNKSKYAALVTAFSITLTGVLPSLPATTPIAAAAADRYTYKLPANLEKYLYVHRGMVKIINPQQEQVLKKNQWNAYLYDMDPYRSEKTYYMDSYNFNTSRKGFLLALYNWIGLLPPVYPQNVDLEGLNKKIAAAEPSDYNGSEEWRKLLQQRGEIQLQARLQAMVQAGYVKPEEITEEKATKKFVANVLYRMFKDVRPYKGSVKLNDTQDLALHWAVELGVPGFEIDSQGKVYPENLLSLDPGPQAPGGEFAYERCMDFLTLILPGKKTATGWEYYQVQLLPGMVPVRPQDLMLVNGKPLESWRVHEGASYYAANKAIAGYAVPRFAQMLQRVRQDTMKPRVWDWRRDLIQNPLFSKQIATYKRTKSSKDLNVLYQAVRNHYHLYLRQDSADIIKHVVQNVK
ncbi:hypothetical protein [Brevibacillus migulae]|uniref:hypothetical protein n=1 Tax=Brevibacillus migulae TaxID=1644114 RepID=UPI00106E8952|nr:hypothetical protein [Brevibacillus migulae]